MSSSDSDPRLLTGRFNSPVSDASSFVSGGEILVGKLASTLLGALWLTFVSGWITIAQAIVQIHVSILNAGAEMYREILLALGANAERASTVAWGEAFRAAVDASPVLAPTIFSIEIVIVSALLVGAARRWT